MNKNTTHLLAELGFSEKEVKVFLASMNLGEANVNKIARQVKLPRTTVGSILERLCEKGYVTKHKSRQGFVYWIEDPHILLEHHKAKMTVIEQLTGLLHVEYHKSDVRPDAEILTTSESIVNLILRVIEHTPQGGEILTIESPSSRHYQSLMSDEMFFEIGKKKYKKNIRTRILIPSGSQKDIRPKSLHPSKTLRILPQGIFFDISLWLYGNSVVIFSGTHTFAVHIEHQHTKESMQSLFEFLWNMSVLLEDKQS